MGMRPRAFKNTISIFFPVSSGFDPETVFGKHTPDAIQGTVCVGSRLTSTPHNLLTIDPFVLFLFYLILLPQSRTKKEHESSGWLPLSANMSA